MLHNSAGIVFFILFSICLGSYAVCSHHFYWHLVRKFIFLLIRNLCLVLRLFLIYVETLNASLSHFPSPLLPPEHKEELMLKHVLISHLLRNVPLACPCQNFR